MRCGAEDFQGAAIDEGVAPGPGIVGAKGAGDLLSGLGPVDADIRSGELADVGGVGVVLGDAGRVSAGQQIESLLQSGGGEFGEAIMQAAAGFAAIQRRANGEQDVPGIEAFIHEHEGDAGFGIARFDGSLNRGGSAILGQQRGVDVQATKTRHIKHRAAEDLTVGDDDGDIRIQGAKFFDRVPDFDRLQHGYAVFER